MITYLHDKQGADERACLKIPDFDKTILAACENGVSADHERKHGADTAIKRVEELRGTI